MSEHPKKAVVAGIGEVLWDVFPTYKRPGGAPANVAFNVNALGSKGVILSAVGQDEPGNELLELLENFGLDTSYVQRHPSMPTGKVTVSFDGTEPSYQIHEGVAWDFINWNDRLEKLADTANAACFSTLAQRNTASKQTIHRFLKRMKPESIRVLDVNLRPPYYTKEILEESLRVANVVKVNQQEMQLMADMFGKEDILSYLIDHCGMRYVCVTLGENGSKLVSSEGEWIHPGYKVNMSTGDLVGVGDAFISCIIHHLLKGTGPEEMLAKSNRYASHLVTRSGAINAVPPEILEEVR